MNNAFYRLPAPETFKAWRERTPDDFVVVVKVSRYLTHVKRLRDPAEPVTRFLEHAAPLGDKLGPLLVQLPPNLKVDAAALDEVLTLFGEHRVTVEFRHNTWFVDEVRQILEHHGAALCLADRESKVISPLWRTADWGYVRWHSGAASPYPCYGRAALQTWADRIADLWGPDDEVYAFFNNDPQGCALRDARWFARSAERAGLAPTRVLGPRDVRVG